MPNAWCIIKELVLWAAASAYTFSVCEKRISLCWFQSSLINYFPTERFLQFQFRFWQPTGYIRKTTSHSQEAIMRRGSYTMFTALLWLMFDTWEQSSYSVSEKTPVSVHSLWIYSLNQARLFSGIDWLLYKAVHLTDRCDPDLWKTAIANVTACLSLQNLPSLAHIKQHNIVLEESFCCQLLLWFDRRSDLRFPIRKHSSSAGKGSQGPDGASFPFVSYLYNLL